MRWDEMNQRTWPYRSDGSHYVSLPFPSDTHRQINCHGFSKPCGRQFRFGYIPSSSRSNHHRDFSMLPNDVLTKIAANFTLPNLQSASLVCKSWRDALRPLREAMLFLRWGKRFKHGRAGLCPNLHKALDSFLKGAARGSTLAMVDAGLVYWEMGNKGKGIELYRKAAELGDPAGQLNLGISYLQGNPSRMSITTDFSFIINYVCFDGECVFWLIVVNN